MFTCTECNQKTKEKHRTFQCVDWCNSCVKKESQRNIKEDSVPGEPYTRTRPPKYMFANDPLLMKQYYP